jgi:hypothetical protein
MFGISLGSSELFLVNLLGGFAEHDRGVGGAVLRA